MSLFKAFVIVDSKMDSFHVPFFAATDGSALRQFRDVYDSPNSLIAKYPADFTLLAIGTFDSQVGALARFSEFYDLGTALQFVSQPPADVSFDPSVARSSGGSGPVGPISA